MSHLDTSKLVDGYRKAFIDARQQSDPDTTPRFVSNSNGGRVLSEIENEMDGCQSVFMSVAFINYSGYLSLSGKLDDAEKKWLMEQGVCDSVQLSARDKPIRILTTDYLTFSEPKALDRLASLKNVELRMFRVTNGIGFHTKGYMFRKDGQLRVIVGSSNLTQSALGQNYEWNTKIITTEDGQYAKDIVKEFEDVWNVSLSYDQCRAEYAVQYEKSRQERIAVRKLVSGIGISDTYTALTPNAMQKTFSTEIERLVRAGQHRALLISATGTGKTYASAFAVRNIFAEALIHNKKVLFLSHREMINTQAEKSYQRVLGPGFTTAQLSGGNKDWERILGANVVFSTMNMMAKDETLCQKFSPEHFSFIIVDECHRALSPSYQRIIDHFKPDFLLGMSASPDRTADAKKDGEQSDVYSLFDHNIACEIRLQTALENDLLCPFHYFGIQDFEVGCHEKDYSDSRPLTADERVRRIKFLASGARVAHIVERAEYYGHSGDRVRGLIFCSGTKEAEELAGQFNKVRRKDGLLYQTIALTGADSEEVRQAAVARLESKLDRREDQLDYIITVDIFNEGVDIPEINQVIMLRPTQSAIIFVQQLGRGLRKAEGKEFVVVIDFIANYDNNFLIPIALFGDRTGNKDKIRRTLLEGNKLIRGASTIYFDSVSKEKIFKALDKASLNQKKIILDGYNALKAKLGRRPAMSEFDKYGEMDPLRILRFANANLKGRASYHGFQVAYDHLEETLSPKENHLLEFVSQKFASGKRLNELIMLEVLLDGYDAGALEEWRRRMLVEGLPVGDYAEENIVRVFKGQFFTNYKDCVLLEGEGDFRASAVLKAAMCNNDFGNAVRELVEFARLRYQQVYNAGSELVIGQKYSYEDVCRLLNWNQNESATIGGYKYDRRTNTLPIFVNYEKGEDISRTTMYGDKFIAPGSMVWVTKNNRHYDADCPERSSKDVRIITSSKYDGKDVDMMMFIRKNKDDKETSKEFYYLGKVYYLPNVDADGVDTNVAEVTMPDTDNVSVVQMKLRFETPVDRNLYDYLTSSEG